MPDENDWGPDRAGAALAVVSAQLGLRAEPLLIRASGNVVYRCGDHIAKVCRPTDVIPQMATAALTAGALAAAGAPDCVALGNRAILVWDRKRVGSGATFGPLAARGTPPPPGWYADPVEPQLVRWWDGWGWTLHWAGAWHAGAGPE